MENGTAKSVIAADVEFTGTIKCASEIRIDGKLEGELHCEKDVAIGKSAVIKGNMTVNSATVEGTVNGNVTARDRIELKASARLTGDIKSKRLTVEDGVTFVGRSEVNPSAAPGQAAKPAPAAPEAEPPKGDAKPASGVFGRR